MNFKLPASADIYLIEGEYSGLLVVLSCFIAFSASYTALFINRRIQGTGFFHKNVWLVMASLAMGLGIWSMHFIGMSAFILPVHMEYHVGLTILSMLPAILASYLAFYLANKKNEKFTILVPGIFMGGGISLMHYLGMMAMEVEAHYVYKPVLFILSILLAIGASMSSLYIFSIVNHIMDKISIKVCVSILMTLAIASMHYTGMLSIQFYVTPEDLVALHSLQGQHSMDIWSAIFFITIGMLSLFTLAYLTSHLDKYVEFRLGYFDALTHLPNQKQFEGDQQNENYAYLAAIIHLENLDSYISGYGYSFGDTIIKSVQELLEEVLPKPTKMYRTEANRFLVIGTTLEQSKEIMVGLEQVCIILNRSLLIDEYFINVEMICTVSTSSEEKRTQEHAVNALAVLQAPRKEYQNEVIVYDPHVHTFQFERQLSLDIRDAMKNDDLYVVYQPKIDLSQKRLVGVEALIRWKHPIFGLVSPAVFIPMLENSQNISDVTDWIIGKVCHQIACWNDGNILFQQVAINIPGVYITSPRLAEVLDDYLVKYRIFPNQIELEITETSVVCDMQNAVTAVNKFREKGLSIALDDFGTGVSSLSYLKKLPISTIKIDKSFIDDIPGSDKDASILKSIVSLCLSLGLLVVIEGVETEQQVNFLYEMEHQVVLQGYYYSKPLVAEEFQGWVEQWMMDYGATAN